ncbi:MAG: hypothetical protein FJ100_11355 [Deltaproteobacteria bacterium]|nr:hypothetical protein [Deltaproteobacteria bacterium]
MVLKKYANRRLYDTGTSKYVTLDEVTDRIRAGEDVLVVDAATGADLTQATLTQLILENRGAAKLLPVPLLTQLVRLGDDGLAEFFSRWVQWALESYLHGKQSMTWLQHLAPLLQAGQLPPNPLAPFVPQQWQPQWPPQVPSQWQGQWPLGALAALFEQRAPQPSGAAAAAQKSSAPVHPGPPPPPPGSPPPPAGPAHAAAEELQRLRQQLDEVRASLGGRKRGPKKKGPESDVGGEGG